MPTEKNVTITVNDDGTIDLQKFAGYPDLAKVKQLVDGLRGSVEELKPKAARVTEIGSSDLQTTSRRGDPAPVIVIQAEGSEFAGSTIARRGSF